MMVENGQDTERTHEGGWLHRLADWVLFPVSVGVITNLLAALVIGAIEWRGIGWINEIALIAAVFAGFLKLRVDLRK
jgi:hypothetical protein